MIFQDKIRAIAYALLNTNPDKLREVLATVPDGEPMPALYTWDVYIPLHFIPMSVERAIQNPEEWQPGYVEKVRETLKLNEEIKQILIDKFSKFSFDDEIPYIDYGQSGAGFIYSDEIEDSIEDVFLVKDKSQLTKFGATQLDIDLYVAACKLQVREMERLLQMGANPEAKICSDGEEWEVLDRVGTEAAFLGTLINSALTHERTASVEVDHDGGVSTLISLGLYEMMYALFLNSAERNSPASIWSLMEH